MPSTPAVTESLKLESSALISLFKLDARPVGGIVNYFTCAREVNGAYVSFGGQTYTPLDVVFEGVETSGIGALPEPTLKIAITDGPTGIVQAMLNTYGDLHGCPIERIRTWEKFLDGHANPDGAAFFGPDKFVLDQKTEDEVTHVTWKLSASIDQQGKMLPGRVAIRDTCMWRYREWVSGTTFDTSKAICPYNGTNYWDAFDNPTTADKDTPSRTRTCCELRFGKKNPLPFGGFPGIARVG